MHFGQREYSYWKHSWKFLYETVFIAVVSASLTLRATLKQCPQKTSSQDTCSLAVHLLKHSRCFCRSFLKTLVEFVIHTLFFKQIFCIQRTRTIIVHWYTLSRNFLHCEHTCSFPYLTSHVYLRDSYNSFLLLQS